MHAQKLMDYLVYLYAKAPKIPARTNYGTLNRANGAKKDRSF